MTDTERLPKGKNIAVFSDGTGQKGGVGFNTNVYRLFSMIEDRTNDQIAFYDPGLGTAWNKLSGNILGVGIQKNILECYQFISDHYQWKDRIFLFGFSRGAATVRSLAGFIFRFGILPHSRPELVKTAWAIYEDRSDAREKNIDKFLSRNPTTWCNIEFIGVWDTVAALGTIPGTKHKFHDFTLSQCVQYAYHAMSIDEDRKAFLLEPFITQANGKSLLGDVLEDPKYAWEIDQKPEDLWPRKQIVRQVWFSGVHTDVGGGYETSGLSDIPLLWMVDRATDGKVLEHPLRLAAFNSIKREQNAHDVMHSERNTFRKRLMFRPGQRTWDPETCGKPVIHASVLARRDGNGGARGVPYRPWILETFKEGEYEIEPWENEGTPRAPPFPSLLASTLA